MSFQVRVNCHFKNHTLFICINLCLSSILSLWVWRADFFTGTILSFTISFVLHDSGSASPATLHRSVWEGYRTLEREEEGEEGRV